ncbi:hypothetical protein A9Q91_01800 [Candidatus Gracilibacteria bacterium 28_42_T64]|nr:hypothetical protein A9Q91_01800 [Candidatus Gracilibacteria bacterium 28_42_T64]
MKQKFLEATRNILFQNMRVTDERVVLVYDLNSALSKEVSEGYIQNLKERKNTELIDFDQIEKPDLKERLFNLIEGSTVILVQSTNFRLDDFRIRLNLHNAGVGCLEHNHLAYIKDDQIENYADAIEYKTPYYDQLSSALKDKLDNANKLTVETSGNGRLEIEGGFENMKQNTGNYNGKKRGGTFPIGENFSEAKDFVQVNGEITIYAYPDFNFEVQFCEPFRIKISESKITCDDQNCPEEFRKLLDKISDSEDGEVFMRELGFGINTGITKQKPLSDVNAFERVTGFHMSLGKKHNIYRKKIHKSIIQRYHIDIFPDIERILIDGEVVFEGEKYVIEK